MKRAVALITMGVLLAGVAWLARGPVDPAASVYHAYRARDCRTALARYEEAEQSGHNPVLMVHNQAAALYRMDQFGDAQARYQRAGEDARRNYDRGNCVLRNACRSSGAPDRELLLRAQELYEECL